MKKLLSTTCILALLILVSCRHAEKKAQINKDSMFSAVPTDTGIYKNALATDLDTTDIIFFKRTALTSLSEIETSAKIIQLGSTPEIINFAKGLVSDLHTQNAKLSELAKRKGYEIPKVLPPSLADLTNQMQAYKADGRNEYYIQAIINGHATLINQYMTVRKSKDLDISAFAGAGLALLKKQEKEIKAIEQQLTEPKAGQGDDPLKLSNQKSKK